MKSSTLAMGAGAVFLLVLGYLTMASMPTPPPTGVEHTASGAEAACAEAVDEQLVEAHFPFGANVLYEGDARYRLTGTVEMNLDGQRVRRMYECLVSYSDAGVYRADSVTVWQSH
jgi:hypothetical protein